MVSEGENGNSCDHSDWLEPKLVGPAGELKLTDLNWKSLDGFGGGKIDRNYEGKPIRVGEDLLTKVLGKDGPLAVSNDDLENFLSGEKQEQLTKLKADLQDAKTMAPPMYPIAHSYADGSGRRELAEAIASADNPLTVRVIVNRIWPHHFGRGIVATPSNFGKQGLAPTHPALLDYLAARFLESGWSIKSLHREIMLSATYQLSTSFSETNASIERHPSHQRCLAFTQLAA